MSNSQNSGSFITITKPSSNTSASAQLTQTSGVPSSSNDTQRRSGGGPIAGSSVSTRGNSAAPRSGQAGRKSHRNRRKPGAPRSEEVNVDNQATMTTQNRRKGTSITHLMNWNLPAPRSPLHNTNGYGATFGYRSQDNSRQHPAYVGSGYHSEDKARYVNANYRFIAHPGGDFSAQAIDPDSPLPWNHVAQVLASAQSQKPSCPICLSSPVAPRMARCGHIFCLPCLLRYMATVEETPVAEKKPKYKKCVICMDSIYPSDVRPVRFYTGQENEAPREGGDVVLRLVMKRMGSVLALPKDGADSPVQVDEIPWHFAAEVMDYARIMKGTENYMIQQHIREVEDLEQMEREDEVMFGDDGEWTRKAVSNIKKEIEAVKGMGNPEGYPPELTEREKEKKPEIQFNSNEEGTPLMYHLINEAHSGHSSSSNSRSETPLQNRPEAQVPTAQPQSEISELSPSLAKAQETLRRRHGLNGLSRGDAPYYFYQALPHFYLTPLDIRILKTAFGSFGNFPSTILPRVENVLTGHLVDDDFRKRTKYLAHLPYGCEISFLECDWTDIVPAEVLETFSAEIERRRKQKQEKDHREERDRIRAERESDEARWAHAKLKKEPLRDDNEEVFAAMIAAQNLIEAETSGGESSSAMMGASPPWGHDSLNRQGSSFASLASPSTSPAQGRTVWGTPAVHLSGQPGPDILPPTPADNGGWLTDWERDLLLENELLAQSGSSEGFASGSGHAPSQEKRGKGAQSGKKKFKKVTLMTNGGKRGA